MSVMYCEKHNIRWDSDISDSCVRCETAGHYFQEKCSVCGDYYPYPVGLHHSEDECVAIATKVGVQACREGDRTMLASDAGNELLKKAAATLAAQQEPVADWLNGQEFHELCMDYRAASPALANDCYLRLQECVRKNTAPASGVKEGMLLDALQRAQRVMHGEGVEDQGEAWDKCAQILDEAITRAADQVNVTEDDEALKIGKRWLADSSLETWFPFTAEELARLRAKAADQVNAEGNHE